MKSKTLPVDACTGLGPVNGCSVGGLAARDAASDGGSPR